MATGGVNELSANEIVRGIEAENFTAEEVTRACLARIDARESEILAWAAIDPASALAQARSRDRDARKGPLHGVPVGVKDVIDTGDLPTQMGSPIYQGYRPKRDAACVALLRAAGAVVLGKTITCEFAGATPNVTRNPCNPAHTPGGSSSGSAAAVADFMVPAALGTQTRGSILRPASYCGVVGYKPSYGLVTRDGLKFAAESFDTIGVLARSIEDAAIFGAILSGCEPLPIKEHSAPPAIGICRVGLEHADPCSVAAVEDSAIRLGAAGASVRDFDPRIDFDALTTATKTVNDVERARAMAWEWQTHRDLLSERLRATVEQGLAATPEQYTAALTLAEDERGRLKEALVGIDIVLAPCVNGEAPASLGFSGDPFFQGVWTALHAPTISLPTHRGPGGLPVGIQLVGRRYADAALLAAARWVFARLGRA